MSYDNYLVRLPVRRADRWLEYREAMVPVSADVCVGDLPYTHENVTAQAAKMRGEVYGWGGMLGGRDCSALVGDVYRCFGFRLPRDAAGLALLPARRTCRCFPRRRSARRFAHCRSGRSSISRDTSCSAGVWRTASRGV